MNPGSSEAIEAGCTCPVLPPAAEPRIRHADSPDGCCTWLGAVGNGYGYVRHGGKPVRVHRLSFELANGFVPDELHHDCRNKLCVNPAHLVNGTHADNMQAERKELCRSGRHKLEPDNLVGKDRRCASCHREKVRRQNWTKPIPNPGSDEAIWLGCRCAVLDNGYGKGSMWGPDKFWITKGCPLHYRKEKSS